MTVWALAALVVPCVALGITEHLTPAAFATNVLLPLGVYTLLAGVSRRPWITTLLLFPWTFLSAFQIGHHPFRVHRVRENDPIQDFQFQFSVEV